MSVFAIRLRPHLLESGIDSILQVKHNLQILQPRLIGVLPLLKVGNRLPRILQVMDEVAIVTASTSCIGVKHLAGNGSEVVRLLGDRVNHDWLLLLRGRDVYLLQVGRCLVVNGLHQVFDRLVHVGLRPKRERS